MIACLLPLHIALSAENESVRQRFSFTAACLAVLPLTFGPIVPISHFIFEGTSRSALMVMQGTIVLLVLTLAWRLAARWEVETKPPITKPFAGALLCLSVWLASSMMLSDYEQGVRTPNVWDEPLYVLDWLSAIFAGGILAATAWHIARPTFLSRLPVAAYVVSVTSLAFATLG